MNRSLFRASVVAAALALASTAALAADVFYVGGEPIKHVTEKRWDGAYAGVVTGITKGTVQDINNPVAPALDQDGVIGGIFVGYNWELDNNVVLGVEGDVIIGGGLSTTAAGSNRTNGTASARVRAGYNVNDFALPYVTAGVVGAHTTNSVGNSEASQIVFGYTAGAGIEFALNDTTALRTEYRYTKLQDTAVTFNGVNHNFANDNHSVLLGLSVKF